jgi:signal transduction histidine kinase
MENLPASPDSQESIARDIGAVTRIGAVPSILRMVCDETGMGFAAVARVTDATWTACAVQDNVGFGLKPGGQLELQTTLCFESRGARAAIIVDEFSKDATYRGHHTPAIYGLESYISVPIVLPSGEYFGNLCAIDAKPAKVSEPRVVRMFEVFANLIAMQLDSEKRQWTTEAQLTRERETASLREQFIAVLGHDLRNPLAAVSATAEVLSRRKSEPDLEKMGKRLAATATRMSKLIDDVLDFARGRLGSGMKVAVREVDDIERQLGTVLDEFRSANPSRTLSAVFDVEATVRCDLLRVQQLLANLIANALTYGSADSAIEVRVESRAASRVEGRVDERQGALLLSVANEGEPIPPHLQHKIFDPYWRPSNSAPGGGLGLGLFICKQIVEAHGGELTLVSSAEQGTRFAARIPFARS